MQNNLGSLFFSKAFLNKKGIFEELEFESSRPYKDSYIVKIKGIDSIAQASPLVGSLIYLSQEELEPLEDGRYYVFQIVGSRVKTKDGREIGVVRDILFIQDNDLLVVEGMREILIPLTEDICVKIDPGKKEVIVDPPSGLLELDEI